MRDGPQPFWRRLKLPRTAQFFIGLAIGSLPLLAFFVPWLGLPFQINLGCLFVASVVCICIPAIRYAGYGMLTMVFATPVIIQIACMVMISTSGGIHLHNGRSVATPSKYIIPTPAAKK